MRHIPWVLIFGVLGLGAQAESFNPFEGQELDPITSEACYGRIYSTQHMKDNPQQAVSALSLGFGTSEFGTRLTLQMSASASDADQEQHGVSFASQIYCYEESQKHAEDAGLGKPALMVCGIECDGGLLFLNEIDETHLRFSAYYLRGDEASIGGCEGGYLLIEGELHGEMPLVDYVLYRMPNEACEE